MPVIVSLLRGINVGGNTQIPMQELRKVYERLGFLDVRTYINSGNVLCKAKRMPSASLIGELRGALETAFGFCPEVMFRSPAELNRTIANNPLAERQELDPKKLLVMFLNREPASQACKHIVDANSGPEELYFRGSECFIYFPNGMGRPKLSWQAVEKKLGIAGTGRNWNTVTKLAELATAMGRER